MEQPSVETPTLDPQSWLETHGDYLYAYALKRLGNAHDAEELVQDALLAAYERVDQFEGRSTERTWLTGILRNKILQFFRDRPDDAPIDEEAIGRAVDKQFTRSRKWRKSPARWSGDPEALAESDDFKVVLARCLSKMPDRLAETFLLIETHEHAAATVGEMLGATANNVHVMLYRARSLMRACLERNWFKPPKTKGAKK